MIVCPDALVPFPFAFPDIKGVNGLSEKFTGLRTNFDLRVAGRGAVFFYWKTIFMSML